MAKFTKSGNRVKSGWPEIRNKKMNWGNTALRLTYEYEKGYVCTSKGTKVEAYELIKDSLVVELYDKKSGITIPKPASYFKQFKFDLSYNCFGYCFADSKALLLDPTQFIVEEYEEVDFDDAELILFKEHKGIGDNGEDILIYFHAVKILPNRNVSFKPGINELVENVSDDLAIHNYNFNHEVYLKKKKSI